MIINKIKKATGTYLEGKLDEFNIENIKPDIYKVSIIYKDNYNFNFDYDFEIYTNLKKVRFVRHNIINQLYNVTLNRIENFENSIYHILCE